MLMDQVRESLQRLVVRPMKVYVHAGDDTITAQPVNPVKFGVNRNGVLEMDHDTAIQLFLNMARQFGAAVADEQAIRSRIAEMADSDAIPY